MVVIVPARGPATTFALAIPDGHDDAAFEEEVGDVDRTVERSAAVEAKIEDECPDSCRIEIVPGLVM